MLEERGLWYRFRALLNIRSQVDHISTGGGATINYLAGKDMPAIEALIYNRQRVGG